MGVVFVLEVDRRKVNFMYFGTFARGWTFGRAFWTVCRISSTVTFKWLDKKRVLSLRMRIGTCSCVFAGIFCWHTIMLIYGIQMQSICNTQNFLAGRLVEEIKRAFAEEDVCGVDDKERFILPKFLLEYCCKIYKRECDRSRLQC